MKQKMVAIIRKDLRNITTNKNLFLSLLIVPGFYHYFSVHSRMRHPFYAG